MSQSAAARPSVAPTLPVCPTAEAWAAMSPADRGRFVAQAGLALMAHHEAMGEGSPHGRAKARAARLLGDFFRRSHRLAYLNSDLPVLYPGEAVFCPDLLVVLGVIDPGEQDTRMCWNVIEEGRGLDFVLEILHHGDRQKDLVDNVRRFARLGIEEYFVYDRGLQILYGWRSPYRGAPTYDRIPLQAGALPSKVLGMELVLHQGRLRFLRNGDYILGDDELLDRANSMLDQAIARGDQAAAQAEEAATQAAAAEGRARHEAEARALAEERARHEADARAQAEERAAAEAQARAQAEERARHEADARAQAEERAAAAEARLRALEAQLRGTGDDAT